LERSFTYSAKSRRPAGYSFYKSSRFSQEANAPENHFLTKFIITLSAQFGPLHFKFNANVSDAGHFFQ
jgi:hypothetical protein